MSCNLEHSEQNTLTKWKSARAISLKYKKMVYRFKVFILIFHCKGKGAMSSTIESSSSRTAARELNGLPTSSFDLEKHKDEFFK